MSVAQWSLTLEHWIFYLCATAADCITELTLITYHCYNIYKHEIATTDTFQTPLYKVTTTLSIMLMLIYFLCQSSAWVVIFDCNIEIFGWAVFLYQIAKGLMYIMFLMRLHIVYDTSTYAYNPRLLIMMSVLIILAQIGTGIYGSITFVRYMYTVNVFEREIVTCATTLDIWFMAMLIPSETIIAIGLLIAFIIPLYKLLKSMKDQPENVSQGIRQSAIKLTILTAIALISSILSHPVSVLTKSTVVYGIDIPLNMLCVMLTTRYYSRLYKTICCGVIKCFGSVVIDEMEE